MSLSEHPVDPTGAIPSRIVPPPRSAMPERVAEALDEFRRAVESYARHEAIVTAATLKLPELAVQVSNTLARLRELGIPIKSNPPSRKPVAPRRVGTQLLTGQESEILAKLPGTASEISEAVGRDDLRVRSSLDRIVMKGRARRVPGAVPITWEAV